LSDTAATINTIILKIITRHHLYMLALLSFVISLVCGIVTALVFIAAYTDPVDQYASAPLSDPAMRIIIPLMIFFFAVIVAAGVFVFIHPYKKEVLSLLPLHRKQFVLSGEGIYVMMARRWQGFNFYPWSSLRLYLLNASKAEIGLKSGGAILKLKSTMGFGELKDAVLSHLPADEARREVPEKVLWFRYIVFIVLVVVVIGAWFGMDNLYESLSTGKVGDNRCDICSKNLSSLFFLPGYYVIENDVLTHEYCHDHGIAYALIHPLMTVNTVVQEPGMPLEMLSLLLLSICFWCIVIIIVVYPSIARWYRTPVRRQ
jgi:hypothetical protein